MRQLTRSIPPDFSLGETKESEQQKIFSQCLEGSSSSLTKTHKPESNRRCAVESLRVADRTDPKSEKYSYRDEAMINSYSKA